MPDRHEHLCSRQVGYREICSAVREDEGYKKAGREPSTSTSLFRPPNINRIYHVLCPPALPALHKKGSKVSMNEKKKKNNSNPKPLPPPPPPLRHRVCCAAWFHARKITTTTTSAWQHIHINTPYPSPTTPHHSPKQPLLPPPPPTQKKSLSAHHRHHTDRPDPSGPHPLPEGNKQKEKIRHHSITRCSLAFLCCCCCCRSCVSSCRDRRPPTIYPTQPSPTK